MIAYLRGEAGGELVRDILRDPQTRCFAHAVNLCEVFYDFARASDLATARDALADLARVGTIRIEYLSQDFCEQVSVIKASNRVSLADCFAVALTSWLDATLGTADRHELETPAIQSACRITFIR
jgi:hypothetical protein